MVYPRIVVDIEKIRKNTEIVISMCKKLNIDVAGVTKGYCAYPEIVQAYIDGGVSYLADSRIINFRRLERFDIPKMLIRIPMISEVADVVRYTDISLNSEVDTIIAISNQAIKQQKVHKILLMVDLGDLREGYFYEDELISAVSQIKDLKGVEIIGLGTNSMCYGGIIPDKNTFKRLKHMKLLIEDKFDIQLNFISGGNSSVLHLLMDDNNIDMEELNVITNLRLGDSLITGMESAYDIKFPGTSDDAFILEAQVIELKTKPSVPIGKIGRDAFGHVPRFVDKGIIKRIICGVGQQDMDLESIFPLDESLKIIGGSSDHLLIDGSDSSNEYKVGDIIKFSMKYLSMLRLMTSEYVHKVIKE